MKEKDRLMLTMEKAKWSAVRYICTLALIMAAVSNPAQTGGGFDLSWFSVDAGGGLAEGGVYRLAGAIGQPETAGAPASGGTYELTSGFLQDSSFFPVPVTVSRFSLE